MRTGFLFSCVAVALVSAGCKGDKAAEAPAPAAPIVAVLELPISLRSQGTAPSDAVNVEVSQTAINVKNQPVLTLAGGTVSAGDRGDGGQIAKLTQAVSAGPHAKVLLTLASTIPYDTVASVLASVKGAGAESVVFQVRAPSATTPGYLGLDNFSLHPASKTVEQVAVPGVPTRPWSDFVSQWDAVAQACGSSKTGSCATKPEKIADGGELKMVLHAAGQGVNVEYFRIGPLPEEAPAATDDKAAKGKGKKAKADKGKKKKGKKVEMIDGVPAPKDVVDEVENAPPASEALFQFRAQEAVAAPSAVTETVKPVCGNAACGVVVQAEKTTQFVRVISLLGAAFPDGSTPPHVVFELP